AGAPPRRWPPRWTATILAAVVLAFVAGIASIGITHQTAWLLTSPEPLFEWGVGELLARHQSQNNLQQIGLARHNHHAERGNLPHGGKFTPRGCEPHGWQTFLLPYIEQEHLYRAIDLRRPWDHPVNAERMGALVETYLHPENEEQKTERGYALS